MSNIQRYQELIALVESTKEDFEKFYLRNNKSAAVRLRRKMQEIRTLAKSVRTEVQDIINNDSPDINDTKTSS
jgi:Na+/phosphate symporter